MKKLFTLALSLLTFQSFAQISAGTMEDWHDYNVGGTDLEAPDGWVGSDSAIFAFYEALPIPGLNPQQQITRSTTHHEGDYSARLETVDLGLLLLGGTISNGSISFSGGTLAFEGGAPVNERINFVNAWVRYTPGTSDDSGSITVTAIVTGSNGDSVVGSGSQLIGNTNSQFEFHGAYIIYTDEFVVPEKIQITFNSSGGGTTEEGSVLRVDDVQLSPLSVKNAQLSNAVKCYPNPSSGLVSVYNTLNEEVTIRAFSINGQEVASKQFRGNSTLDLTAQASGMYFYNVTDKNGQALQHGRLSIIK